MNYSRQHAHQLIKWLQGIERPEFRLPVGDYRVRFHNDGSTVTVLRVQNCKDAPRRTTFRGRYLLQFRKLFFFRRRLRVNPLHPRVGNVS